MNANSKKNAIPMHFRSEEAASKFWDTHSAADYWDEMEEVEMEFDIKKHTFLVPLNDRIYQLVRQRAEAEHATIEHIVNILLDRNLTGTIAS
ncbi:MAG: CopG family antitoxin [Candidatus Desantisbacteria bacterium]